MVSYAENVSIWWRHHGTLTIIIYMVHTLLCCGFDKNSILHIILRISWLALGKSHDSHGVIESTLKKMGEVNTTDVQSGAVMIGSNITWYCTIIAGTVFCDNLRENQLFYKGTVLSDIMKTNKVEQPGAYMSVHFINIFGHNSYSMNMTLCSILCTHSHYASWGLGVFFTNKV